MPNPATNDLKVDAQAPSALPAVQENSEELFSGMSPMSHMLLADIIDNAALFQCFELFLKRLHCNENLDFLLAIRNYEKLVDFTRNEQRIRRYATQIYYSYLHPDAPRHVNLSAATFAKLERRVKRTKVQPLMFRSSKREITDLLEKDSIPKFQDSPEYRVWLEEKREALQKEAEAELARSSTETEAESGGETPRVERKRRWWWRRRRDESAEAASSPRENDVVQALDELTVEAELSEERRESVSSAGSSHSSATGDDSTSV
ncbi:MAG: hypothetical protein MHM6MM_005763 [Cercozoa sp. M6MM]